MTYKRGIVDEQLKLAVAATFTATGNGTALNLGSGYAPVGGKPMQAAIDWTALDHTTGDETYNFKIQDSPDDGTYTDRSPSVAATGAAGSIVVQAVIHNPYVRLVHTLAGTTPSITIGDVYLDPILPV